MHDPRSSPSRRDFLTAAVVAVGGVGVGAAAFPFLRALSPARDILAAGVLEIDLSEIGPGELRTVLWRKQPVFLLRRTPEMIAKTASLDPASLLDPARPEDRSLRPEWFVGFGVCTHLGCVPLPDLGGVTGTGQPGFYCPCHGGKYDSLGRRLAGPAPENLHLLPYAFVSDDRVRLGTRAFGGYSENVRTIGGLPKA
ncbi:MAG: ubiquinol-cytochrome c reductase iron-sulfur subunit [Deltaproteobacteria bacterium]|nr:ubiquinol-cytochrome c reductase iron-sulfur subunit [Deltaproteobacteria bacterium]